MVSGDGAVDKITKRCYAQNAEDCRLSHDHFPAIEQEGQKLAVTARQHLVKIAITPDLRGIKWELKCIDIAGSEIGKNRTVVEKQRKDGGKFGS